VAGALFLNQGNPGAVVPVPQADPNPDLKVAANFERFDGLDVPADHPGTTADIYDSTPSSAQYGWNELGHYPRPGAVDQPFGQVFTQGALRGLTNTIGGQPLPVRDWKYQADGRDGYTGSRFPTVQFRQGVGQRGPSELGAAQTVVLGGITNNPPEPGDLSAIIAGVS
jgi:hypothetical protein